jgi:nucleotide-binding universal stress UspA family protein
MAYRTILVHVDDRAQCGARTALAIGLARAMHAHLSGVAATGVSRFLYPTLPTAQHDPTLALHLGFLREQAETGLARFQRQCDAAALASFDSKIIDDEAGAGLCLHARVADLVVVSQADPDDTTLLGELAAADLAAYAVMHAGRPVLLVPRTGWTGKVGSRVLVSWDASREAARAMQLALPFLQAAEQVEIAVFDTRGNDHAALDARSADPLPYLARHGVRATLTVQAVDGRRMLQRRHDIGDALLSLAADRGADLLVMGAYGHSRVRETILGGVTRTVFDAMTLPVLMVH